MSWSLRDRYQIIIFRKFRSFLGAIILLIRYCKLKWTQDGDEKSVPCSRIQLAGITSGKKDRYLITDDAIYLKTFKTIP